MKKMKYLVSAAVVAVSSTYAAGPYAGLQIGLSNQQSIDLGSNQVSGVGGTRDAGSPIMYGINGGYDWALNEKNSLGVYASYVLGSSDDTSNGVKTKTSQQYLTLAAQYQFNFTPEFGVLARAGLALYTDVYYEVGGNKISPDENFMPFVFGIGAEYTIAEKHGILLTYDMYQGGDIDSKVNGSIKSPSYSANNMLSLGYRFKF